MSPPSRGEVARTEYAIRVIGRFSDPLFQRYKHAAEKLSEDFGNIRAKVEGYFETQYEQRLRYIVQDFGGPFNQINQKQALVYVETGEEILFFADAEKFFQWAEKRFKYEDTMMPSYYKRIANEVNYGVMQSQRRSYVVMRFEVDADPSGLSPPPLPRVKIELFDEECPETAQRFMALMEEPAFVGSLIHRVKAGAWIQGGDLVNGSGKNSVIEDFRDESFSFLHDRPGMLGLANRGYKDTNGSQFYITLRELPFLDGTHVVFGRVIAGMDTIVAIGNVATRNERPENAVRLVDAKVLHRSEPVEETEESLAATKVQAMFRGRRDKQRVRELAVERKALERRDENRAAVKVQSLYRGRAAREKASRMKANKKKLAYDSMEDR